jgi:hypothetical protein
LRRLRFIVGGAIVALAVTALSAPVGAADTKGTLAIINGIPGKIVDVCLNGDEIKSGLAYGRAVLKNVVNTGNKNLKFYERDPRRCRGNLLAQKSFPIVAAGDWTIVATKQAPKVVMFDNTGLGEIPPVGAPFPFPIYVWRSAADVTTNFRLKYWLLGGDVPVGPVANPLWVKGDSYASIGAIGYIFELRATLPEDTDVLARARMEFTQNHRYEWVLVGSNPQNLRYVVLDRAISQPSP